MADLLAAHWIVPPDPRGPLGFGVTARSLAGALKIIREAGYAGYLPDDLGSLKVNEGVRVVDLESPYVRAPMGPIVVRGLWYPFSRLGV